MVTFIKRDKNDIFKSTLLSFLLKNRKFLLLLRLLVSALFFYAIYYGFAHQGRDNLFTPALFWGIFWALFMVSTLPSFGRIFCGICPHGFFGKYITALGLKKSMPKWMQNRYIGITLLVVGWWGIYYTFPSFWKSPLTTAMMFAGMTLLAFILYYIYKDMSYCKYICPIGTLTRAYDKLSFTKLETYTDACKDCRSFECATACAYNLKPFSFAKKNQADDCTLCMDCAVSCEAVKFSITKPSEQLFSKFKTLNAEVWTYILILGSIPVSMNFAHGLNRSAIADSMIWNTTAEYLGMSAYGGGFAFVYALLFTLFFSLLGVFLASRVLQKEYSSTFATLGYAYAPLFILGSLGHTLGSFFTHEYQDIVSGFAQAFGFVVEVAPLAHRGDAWLAWFGVLKWLGVIWAFILLYKRLKLIDASKIRKVFGYIFASFLMLFFIGLNLYSGYIFKTYGAKKGAHVSHSSKMAQGEHSSTAHHSKKAVTQAVIEPSSPIYFSLNNPMQKANYKMGGMMHGGERGAVATKSLWLLSGADLESREVLTKSAKELFYYDTREKVKELKSQRKQGLLSYTIELPHNGYYNVYAIDEQENATKKFYKVAKLEYLRASHGGEELYTQEVKKPLETQRVKIDLRRIKSEQEDSFFYRHAMGDLLSFEALFMGKPLANAELLITTQSGWSKRIKTDKDGIAKFHIIRDYFPQSGKFDKRHKEEMLLTLSYTPNAEEEYILTYPLSFYPNKSDYLSSGYALLLITLTLFLGGWILYRYRRNRTRPFSELSHDA